MFETKWLCLYIIGFYVLCIACHCWVGKAGVEKCLRLSSAVLQTCSFGGHTCFQAKNPLGVFLTGKKISPHIAYVTPSPFPLFSGHHICERKDNINLHSTGSGFVRNSSAPLHFLVAGLSGLTKHHFLEDKSPLGIVQEASCQHVRDTFKNTYLFSSLVTQVAHIHAIFYLRLKI